MSRSVIPVSKLGISKNKAAILKIAAIADVPIAKDTIRVNYDGTGNILIGMDILKDWDIHIGTTETGETYLIACPKDQLNDEYYKEVNRIFGIGDSIIAAEINNH